MKTAQETRCEIKSLCVVLFAYNESRNMLRLLRRLHAVIVRELPQAALQYAICVQGTDSTMDEVNTFAGELDPRFRVHATHSPAPLGVGRAAVVAFENVQGTPDAYLMMDCDLNHQPEELPLFLNAAAPRTIVVGSRFCEGGRIVGMPFWKKVLSTVFNAVTSFVLRVPVKDKTSGYRLILGPDIPEIAGKVIGNGFDFYIEFLLRMKNHGLSIVEVPICFLVRTEGVSKMRITRTIFDYIRLIRRLPRIRSEEPGVRNALN